MKSIHQFVDTLIPGDAISNEALQIRDYLRDLGYHSDIYTCASLIEKGFVKKYQHSLKADDGVIFHHSTNSPLVKYMSEIPNKKVLIYHNITPAAFFKEYNYPLFKHFKEGERQNNMLSQGNFKALIGDSQYNISLMNTIVKAPIQEVIPPFLSLQFDKNASRSLHTKTKIEHDFTLIFVGRFAPNKRQDDILHVFEYYQKYLNPRARLFLLGMYAYVDPYFSQIKKYMDERDIRNVTIKAHLTSEELAEMYQNADVFLSMSEHEGFCIPVLESIHFEVPVLAYKIPALEELLPKKYLFSKKDYKKIAEYLYTIEQNKKFRKEMIKEQKKILYKFGENDIKERFKFVISAVFNV